MDKKALLLGAGALMAMMAWGGENAPIALETASTSLVVDRQNGAWRIVHYGGRISADDAVALAWSHWQGANATGQRPAAAYSVYGAKTLSHGVNKYGGLAVQHADGTLTTDPVAVKSEIVPDADGVQHVAFHSKDKFYPFTIIQHFRAMRACDVIETWVELRHEESAAVKLTRMDSAAFCLPLVANAFHIQALTGQWAAENQLTETAVAKGSTVTLGSRSGVRDAWENNASFMLSIGPRASETAGRVIGCSLAWSGAWAMSVYRDQCDFVEIRAGADTSSGAYTLDPGRTLVLPKCMLTYSAKGKGQVSRNMHRWARDWQLPAGHKLRPVLLNSWEGSYFSFTEKVLHDMMDGVKEMGGELFVLDDGWFGTGKYARDDVHRDKVGLGDWVVNPEKLPNGLKGLDAEARQRGLKFGFWVEPEMVNTNSWLFEAHPDWVLREPNRPVYCGRGHSQTVLDYTNPAVRDHIFGQLDALYSEIHELAYIKWDANAEIMNVGSTYLPRDRQANLWFDYTVGLYDLLAKIRAKYPQVDIQACSSGGGHLDYGFLRYADECWASDDSDARERVFIQWGASQFYPACVIGSHVTKTPNHQTGRTVPLKFRFDVAMAGRFGFELHPKDLSAEEIAFAKKCVASYKDIRAVVQQGDLYRLASPYEHTFASLMYVSEDKARAVVFVWSLARSICQDYAAPLHLQGLDPARRYRIHEINVPENGFIHSRANGKTVGGDALAEAGLAVRFRDRKPPSGDYDSAVFVLDAVK